MNFKRFSILALGLLGLMVLLGGIFLLTPVLFPVKPVANPEVAATPQPPQPARLAPSGYYFLLEPVTLKTSSGIYNFSPGTKLQLRSREKDKLHLTDGHVEVVVDAAAVTNDMDVAELAQKNHSELKQKISAIQERKKKSGAGITVAPAPDQIQPPKRSVAPGYYCLVRRVSVFTDSGVVAWPPGTKLALLSRSKGTVRLTDGEMDLNLEETEVTDDLEIAELVQQNYNELQSQIRAILNGHRR